jgi:hypothetical protein
MKKKKKDQKMTNNSALIKLIKKVLFFNKRIFSLCLNNNLFFPLGCIFLSTLFIAFILYPNVIIPQKHYQVGDIVGSDIKAKRDFLVEDTITTEKTRQQAKEEVPPIYMFDEQIWSELKTKIQLAFEQMRKIIEENRVKQLARNAVQTIEGKTSSLSLVSETEMKQAFEAILGINLTLNEFKNLKAQNFSKEIEELLCQLLEPLYVQGIVKTKDIFPEARYGIILTFNTTQTEEKIYNPQRFMSLKEAKQEITSKKYDIYGKTETQTIDTIIKIALNLIQPNIYYDATKTELKKQAATKAVRSIFYQVKKGEMIAREGEKIDHLQLLKLKTQEEIISKKDSLFLFMGIIIIVFTLLWTNKIVLKSFKKDFVEEKTCFFLWLSNILLFLLLSRLTWEIGNLLFQKFPYLSTHAFAYVLPTVGATMLITLFTQPQIGIVVGSLMAALVGLMSGSPLFFIYFLVGSWYVSLRLSSCRYRSKLIRVGLELGLIQMVLSLGIFALEPLSIWQMIINLSFAGLGGISTSIIVLGLISIIETIFGYTSDFRLLELASLDQPILKELMVKAPGSYLHSVIVGQMVEGAAEEIGANPMLARVAAYYHDIGKIKKPLYFIENQIGVENKHDKLNPSLSALIIISHVKEGMDLAKKCHLNNKIIDIIRQHHGTRLITYFYHKAKEQNPNVEEKDFRYPGPKPQTREAGLVMLADAVEAACHSLVDPIPSRIQNTVQKVISEIFLDGQLEECELTLKDIHIIAERFSKVLISVFHHRIEYPELPKKEESEYGSKDKTILKDYYSHEENSQKNKITSSHLELIKG